MAQLALISTATKKTDNNLGDIVGVFPDDHQFSDKEKAKFTIVKIDDSVVEAARPEKRLCYLDGNEWKAIEKQPLYELKYNTQNKTVSHNLTGKALSDVTAEIADKKTEAKKAE